MLERIVYVSRAAPGMVREDVFEIIRTAHRRNPAAGITGGAGGEARCARCRIVVLGQDVIAAAGGREGDGPGSRGGHEARGKCRGGDDAGFHKAIPKLVKVRTRGPVTSGHNRICSEYAPSTIQMHG
jgi:hypothetical protein